MNIRSSTLISNLRKAARIIKSGGDVHSDYFSSASEFAAELERLAGLIEQGYNNPISYLHAFFARKRAKFTWCLPSYDLDDYLAGVKGAEDLGDAIFEAL